jgi:hypothetical protein
LEEPVFSDDDNDENILSHSRRDSDKMLHKKRGRPKGSKKKKTDEDEKIESNKRTRKIVKGNKNYLYRANLFEG